MNLITISGIALIFRHSDDQLETDATILGRFHGYVYEDERFTDYIGGPAEENELAALLIPSGYLRFSFDGKSDHLVAITEYESTRRLNNCELKLLVDYTMGQWSDGVGENFGCFNPYELGVSVQCQTDSPPFVDQRDVEKITG